jgi:hypothetical protein
MQKLSFYERAEKLGHSVASLKAGNKISSVISVANVDELKKLLDHGESESERANRELNLFRDQIDPNSHTTDGLLRKVNAYVYGNGSLSSSDRQLVDAAFPLQVLAVSDNNPVFTVPTDLGTSQTLIVANYGTATIEDQACLNVHNSTLELTMDNLIRNGTAPQGLGDFNILGVPGNTGNQGATGATGGEGSNGTNGYCSSAGIAGPGGTNGKEGNQGQQGVQGEQGGPGLPSMAATITINQSIQGPKIVVYTQSGAGGTGGQGGQGGIGGKGGNGGDGVTCGCTGNGAGSAGPGGPGGPGGVGGSGGNGVNANGNIIVKVPSAYLNQIATVSNIAPYGAPGEGGPGGAGGAAGSAGTGGKHNGDGNGAGPGGIGPVGTRGTSGTITGNPATISVMPL